MQPRPTQLPTPKVQTAQAHNAGGLRAGSRARGILQKLPPALSMARRGEPGRVQGELCGLCNMRQVRATMTVPCN